MGPIGGTSKKHFDELHGRTGLGAFSNGTDLSWLGQYLLSRKLMIGNLPQGTPSQLLPQCYLVRAQGPATQSALSPGGKGDVTYLFGIFKSSDRGQVSRRIGQELNSCQQEDCWKALKCQEETPSDCRHSIIDEGKPKVFTSQPCRPTGSLSKGEFTKPVCNADP
jgi:hypothetical protein